MPPSDSVITLIEKVVERHMVPSLDADHNGRIGWFFDQWVRGTEMPRYVSQLQLKQEGPERYRVTGTARQEGVSADFKALVPLYVELDKAGWARTGVIPMRGAMTVNVDVPLRLPKKPKRALLNAFHDVLARE